MFVEDILPSLEANHTKHSDVSSRLARVENNQKFFILCVLCVLCGKYSFWCSFVFFRLPRRNVMKPGGFPQICVQIGQELDMKFYVHLEANQNKIRGEGNG